MSLPILQRLAHIGIAEETTSGTFEAISAPATNSVFFDAQCNLTNVFEDGRRMPLGSTLGTWKSRVGKIVAEFSFTMEVRYQDASALILKGLGGTGTTAFTPTNNIALRKTLSLKFWEGGKVKKVKGAVLTGNLKYAAGGRLFFEVSGQGAPVLDLGNPAEPKWEVAESLPSAAPINTASYTAKGVTLTLGSFTPMISNFDLDFGNTLAMRSDPTDPSGVRSFLITEREPKLEIDPEARLIADRDAFALMLAENQSALNNVISDGTRNFTIAAPAVQHVNITPGDRDKMRIDQVQLDLNESSGGDAWTITLPA